jgi:hypothetical protein
LREGTAPVIELFRHALLGAADDFGGPLRKLLDDFFHVGVEGGLKELVPLRPSGVHFGFEALAPFGGSAIVGDSEFL